MSIITLISGGLLVAILLWTIYHVPILFAGIRRKSNHSHSNTSKLPKISLIVPAKDEEAVIARCLKALLSLDYPKAKMEIIVVEGGSKDATREICSEYSRNHPRVIRVLRQETSKGKPAAINLALLHTTGEIIGVFDADSVPERNALRKVSSYFEDPSTMAVQGRPLSLNEGKNMLTKVAAKEERAWFQTLLQGRESLKLFIPLTGSCLFIRRRVLGETGGLDEDSLAEDVELALTLAERGYSIKYADDVCSWQETPSTLRSLITQRTRWYRGYMEAALKYGRLLKKLSKKTIDAEVSLAGPYVMTLCLASYFNWLLSMLFHQQTTSPLINPATLAVALTAVTLFLIGTALTFMEKPRGLKNLLWIPFIYMYWLTQTAIAGWAFLQILVHRPRVWKRTHKTGFVTTNSACMPPKSIEEIEKEIEQPEKG